MRHDEVARHRTGRASGSVARVLSLGLLFVSAAARPEVSGCRATGLSADELAAVAAADRAYAEAWLTNEPDRVMATLGRDPVIVPSGMDAVAGRESIRAFWYPPGSPATTVHRFDLAQDEVGGAGDVGFARGSFRLSFDYDGRSYESEGTYFTLLRRQDDGAWRISRRTWNDHRRSTPD